MPGCDLCGAGILVTRAAHQAASLCRLIEQHGGQAERFPCLLIAPPADVPRLQQLFGAINDLDILIFVSPNAVREALRWLPADRLPGQLQLAAVGQGSARALQAAGLPVAIVPQGRFDSESLLAMPELNEVKGRRILIVRGDGGRALLGERLRQRGAEVSYAEVYRRLCPQADPAPLLARWRGAVDLVTVTSIELLDNLFSLLGEAGRHYLLETPLLVISERMQRHATALGCQQIVLAERADDQAIFQSLCHWATDHQ